MKKRLSRFYARHGTSLRRHGRRAFHVSWYGFAVVVAMLAAVFVLARFLLPVATDRKADLEALLSRESGYEIRIAHLEHHWDGLYPGLRMLGIEVRANDSKRVAVQLEEMRVSLQILPLLWGQVYVHSGILVRPSLSLERLSDGGFNIQGFTTAEQTDSAQTDAFMSWLFRQKNLAIEDGQLQWFDWREPGRVLKMTDVNLQLRNRGEHHRLGMAARFPADICARCSLVADVDGNPLLGKPFDGDVYVRADQVNVERLPLVIREHLPKSLQGLFSAELWSEWKESLPVHVDGNLSVAGLRFPLAGLRAPLSVKQAATTLRWDAKKAGFGITLDDLTLALHGRPWSAGTLQFERDGGETAVSVDRVELGDITAFIADADPTVVDMPSTPHEVIAVWNALRPAGVVKDLRVRLDGELEAPQEYTLAADVENLAARPYKGLPGLSGISGTLWTSHDEGRIKLNVRAGALALPEVFRAPLPITHADADVRWERAGQQWIFTSERITFRNEDVQANGRLLLRLPQDSARSPYLAMHMDFRDGNGANVARYYPVHQLSPALLKWMEDSFAGGIITRGSLVFEGETRSFPFRDGTGKFEIRAAARDGVYRYLRGWDPVTDVAANVYVNGDQFVVTGSGRIGALKAADIMVRGVEDRTVRVSTNVSGPVAESVRVLRAVNDPKAVAWKKWIPDRLRASGNGTLSLDLAVSIRDSKTHVRGEYRLLNAALHLTDTPLEASRVNGVLRFSEDGIREGRVLAQLLGGEATLAITSPHPDDTMVVLQGQTTMAGLAPVLGKKFSPFVSGPMPWQANMRSARGITEISGEADVSALRFSLPAPLNRPNGLGVDKLVFRTDSATPDELTLAVKAGNLLDGRLKIQRRDGWRLVAGRVAFSETPPPVLEPVSLPTESDLHVRLSLDAFDVDPWRTLLTDEKAAASTTPAWLSRVSAEVRSLTLLGRDFGDVNIELMREKNGWVGGVSGAASEGRMRIETTPATRIHLDFKHLRLPSAKDDQAKTTTDPRTLPYLSVKAKSFQIKDKNVGELDFLALPMPQGWKIERAVLVRPEARLEVDGSWRVEYGQANSNVNVRFNTRDTGKTLEAFGLPQQIENAETELNLRLGWTGALADVNVASMNGVLELNAKNGRFLKVDQGAARLFGLLDFSAIGRYLTLDFSPLFGKGFAFDRVNGKVTLERGNAYTDDFSIKGPTARLVFGGRVGLAAEDFGLTMDVYPSLSDSLTLGSFLAGGPQVALWALIVNKLFKKQIEEGTRVTYLIRGPWDKPEINRRLIERPTMEFTPN